MEMSPTSPTAMTANRTNHTPPLPISKRDKRRNLLAEKLSELTDGFQGNRDSHYRSQLHAIQTDVHLIMHADVYDEENPLPDYAEDIRNLVQNATGMIQQGNGMSPDASPMAGKLYSEFVQEVQDALERRDAELVMHKREYEHRLKAISFSNQLKIRLAEREHRALAETLRDRLINSVTSKKARLLRDKEALDITDSNAVLLHPSQFSITNPASPSGIHQKRATRHRREVGEITNFPEENNKRKRKGADDDGSPAPTRRALDNGTSTPHWRLDRDAQIQKQFDTPLYSIDKLFTEKELAMNYNHAAQAAYEYIVHHKVVVSEGGSPPNGRSSTNSDHPDNQGPNDDKDDAGGSPPGPPAMERHFSHATRSTRGAANGNYVFPNGVEGVLDIALPQNISRISTMLPKNAPLIPSNMATSWRKETANQPQQATDEQVAADIYHIKQCKLVNKAEVDGRINPVRSLDLNGDRDVLKEILAPPGKFQTYITVPDDKIPSREERQKEEATQTAYSHLRNEVNVDNMGGVGMSKQSSVAGYSEAGGIPMSRSGTNDMSRQGNEGGGRRRGR